MRYARRQLLHLSAAAVLAFLSTMAIADPAPKISIKTTMGEILFFANGKKEIEDALEFLNTNMPSGNIALPYYSNLNNNYKEIRSRIDTKIKTIKNKRENIKG